MESYLEEAAKRITVDIVVFDKNTSRVLDGATIQLSEVDKYLTQINKKYSRGDKFINPLNDKEINPAWHIRPAK